MIREKNIATEQVEQRKGRRSSVRLLLFVMVFGFIKLSGFASALLLSGICSLADYGKYEYALAAGLILAIPLNIGLQGAYPYFNLRLRKRGFRAIFYFHSISVCFVFLFLLLIDLLFIQLLNEKLTMAILFGVVFSMQILLSSILKSHGSMFRAVLMDGGVFLMVNALILYYILMQEQFSFYSLQWILMAYALGLFFINVYWWRRFREDYSWVKYLIALRYGKPLVLSSFLIILFTGGGRIFIEIFIDMETLGHYAYYLRFATITIMIQQIFLIAFFRKVYQAPPKILDQYFAPFLLVILVISLLLWAAIPFLLSSHLPLLRDTITQFRPLYFVLCFHTLIWACLSFNENIIHREELTGRMNIGLLIILIIMLMVFYLLWKSDLLNVFNLSMINVLAIYAATEVQFSLLSRARNFKMINSRVLIRVIMLLFCISFFVI